MDKKLSASGGPDRPPGALPLNTAPPFRLALRALAMVPLPNPGSATVLNYCHSWDK